MPLSNCFSEDMHWLYSFQPLTPLTAKFFNLNIHPLEVVSFLSLIHAHWLEEHMPNTDAPEGPSNQHSVRRIWLIRITSITRYTYNKQIESACNSFAQPVFSALKFSKRSLNSTLEFNNACWNTSMLCVIRALCMTQWRIDTKLLANISLQ